MRQMIVVVPFVLISMVIIGVVVSGVALINGALILRPSRRRRRRPARGW